MSGAQNPKNTAVPPRRGVTFEWIFRSDGTSSAPRKCASRRADGVVKNAPRAATMKIPINVFILGSQPPKDIQVARDHFVFRKFMGHALPARFAETFGESGDFH